MLAGGRYFVVAEYAFDGDGVRHLAVLGVVKRIHVRVVAAVECSNLFAEVGIVLNGRRADCSCGVVGLRSIFGRAVREVYVQHIGCGQRHGGWIWRLTGLRSGLICGLDIIRRHGAGVNPRQCDLAMSLIFQLPSTGGVTTQEEVMRRLAQLPCGRNGVLQFTVEIDLDLLPVIGANHMVPGPLNDGCLRLLISSADVCPKLQGVGVAFLFKAETGTLCVAHRVVVLCVQRLVIQLDGEILGQLFVIIRCHCVTQAVIHTIEASYRPAQRAVLFELRRSISRQGVFFGVCTGRIFREINIQDRLSGIDRLVALPGGDRRCCGNTCALYAKRSHCFDRDKIRCVGCQVLDLDGPLRFRGSLIVIRKDLFGHGLLRFGVGQGDPVFVDHIRIADSGRSCRWELDRHGRAAGAGGCDLGVLSKCRCCRVFSDFCIN